MRLSFRGEHFHGWQSQPHDISVQETVEKVLSTLLRTPTGITGAGRTDAKVNAKMMIAHFDADQPIADTAKLIHSMNGILDRNVAIHAIFPVHDTAHARFDATKREYHYFLHRKKDPFMDKRSYLYRFDLNVEAMNQAAEYLLGTHDFSCFEKVGGNNKTSICTIYDACWKTWDPDHVRMMGYPKDENDYLVFTVNADRFLRNMVRAIVGTLVDVGRGKITVGQFCEIIEKKDRCEAGTSVPGNALFLWDITYPYIS